MADLVFCALFPFSEQARTFLKEKNVALDNIPDYVIKRAALMISRANSGQDYIIDLSNSHDVLENEIIAFPTAKLIVSLMRTPNVIEKFCSLVRKRTFDALVSNDNSKELCFSLADDFALSYKISEKDILRVELDLIDYLGINFVDDESKLINKHVSKGKVLLNLNDFSRFLSEKAYKKVKDSLPIEKKHIPKVFEEYAKSIDPQLAVIEKKNFDLRVTGKVDPELFPPCIKTLYTDQTAGKKLSHMARVALASFLFQVNMPKQDVSALFAKSPDYKKHLADYHVDRIFQKKFSAPGCKKMAEYDLKVKECEKECTYKHPLSYYLAKMRIKNRTKGKRGE